MSAPAWSETEGGRSSGRFKSSRLLSDQIHDFSEISARTSLEPGKMSRDRRHLQELLSESNNLPNWEVSLIQDTKKPPCRDSCDQENTPQELIHRWSPPRKQLKTSKGKENEDVPFVLARRPRRKRELTGFSWENLPDELLLGIFRNFSLVDLLRVSRVCKKWHRLTLDESLWHSVDLVGKAQLGVALSQVLMLGIKALRCPRSCIGEPSFTTTEPLRVKHIDFSSSTVTTPVLEDIIGRCRELQNLSLEGLELSDGILQSLSQNPELVRLNFSGCLGFSSQSLSEMLQNCSRLEELNLSWCDFSSEHIKAVVSTLPASLTQLNLSGYRQNLQMDDVKDLVNRCPNLTDLDLSDSVLLTPDSFQYFQQLSVLEHLALSRCYQIHPAALAEFEKFPSLKTLEVFGIVQDTYLPILKKGLPHIKINTCCFTTIARPSVAGQKNRTMWAIQCRLEYRPSLYS
ncbi:S-phase kinase-associated protein 2 [Amia ocellicauda]|uniref:S-phase kinase-associated protein 2 n=1 Tax=Amia ocellicauda TaxID=2972642 RepID=UPI00346488DA